ncbi:hypothetical protein C1645_730753 [Glomus cerebriforme]|uniref:BRCT domain-containing protein n=1 Tax=Glomus cerebriforme TaxID=658196 RepID=A0A397TTG3_9GLOM|nr:hypothetical protein C1645_730753 [Glomus cerebriforme]
MFQDTSAWFSSSVDRAYIDLWIRQGGSVEDQYKDDKLPEYLFSCDPKEYDTQRLIKHISYIVIHPDWIFDTIIDKKRKPIEQYILLNYDSQDTNVDKVTSIIHITDNNKINSTGSDILTDLVNHNQVNDNFIIAHSSSIPDKKYYLPRRRARKVSKGKNPVQENNDNYDNNVQQSTTMDAMNIQDNEASQDLQIIDMQIDSDLQSDTQTEGNGRSAINNPNEDLEVNSKRDRPRTLPDFMSKKRPKVILTSSSEDDSFFSDFSEEDSNENRKRSNNTKNSVRTSSTGKKAPSLRCECGRTVETNITATQLLAKDPPQNVNKQERSITSIRLQHISIRSLLEKVFKYLRVVKGSNSSLMDDVCEFTPGRNGFSARLKSTINSRVTNPQTRGKSSFRKT